MGDILNKFLNRIKKCQRGGLAWIQSRKSKQYINQWVEMLQYEKINWENIIF